MGDTTYEPVVPVTDLGDNGETAVGAPYIAPPFGLYSVANIVDDPSPVRWGVIGSRYELLSRLKTASTASGVVAMDSTAPCPSPTHPAGDALVWGKANAYMLYSRIACTGPGSDAPSYAAVQFANREERLAERALDLLFGDVTGGNVGTDAVVGLAAVEAQLAELHTGQALICVSNAVAYALESVLTTISTGLYTLAGNRVSVSPLYGVAGGDINALPVPNMHRSATETLDNFDRSNNLNDALVSRQIMFVTDPAADTVVGNLV